MITFNHATQASDITVCVQEYTVGQHAISSSTPCFLVISFHRFGQRVMNHKTHISLVNAHAKSNGGTDNLIEQINVHYVNQGVE